MAKQKETKASVKEEVSSDRPHAALGVSCLGAGWVSPSVPSSKRFPAEAAARVAAVLPAPTSEAEGAAGPRDASPSWEPELFSFARAGLDGEAWDRSTPSAAASCDPGQLPALSN